MHARIVALTAGLLACATPSVTPARPEAAASRWGPYELELVDEGGVGLPTFEHRRRAYVLGQLGQRYLVRVRNGSWRRIEVVVSVDGRDVVDGRPAAWQKRGYLVEPYGEVRIDGFRLSGEAVAAFRFSSVPRSYAARMGDARDVGVIGVAVFPERAPRPPAPLRPLEREPASDAASRAGAKASEAAPSANAPSGPTARSERQGAERPGLGTEFAEEHASYAQQVPFERERARPDAVLTLRYDDRQGLLALGVPVDGRVQRGDPWLRESAEPFRRDAAFAEPPPGWRP